jgi:thioredoxin
MSVLAIHSDESFKTAYQMAEPNQLICIDFTAKWCGPCRRISPMVEKLSQHFPQVLMMKVDVDECPETTKVFQVGSMPTFVFVRNGQLAHQFSGANPKQLQDILVQLTSPPRPPAPQDQQSGN